MKTQNTVRKLIFSLWIITIFFLPSCIDNEQEDLNRQDSELISLLKSDKLFQGYFSKQIELQKMIYDRIASSRKNNQLIEVSSVQEISEILELPEGLFENHELLVSKMILHLYTEYPELNQMKENRIFEILSKSRNEIFAKPTISNLKSSNYRILDSCDDRFAEDFNRIHHNYDFSVFMCFALAGVSGHAGVITCEAMALVNMTIQMAQAMDNHTLCKAAN
jgi:hypothetical protein